MLSCETRLSQSFRGELSAVTEASGVGNPVPDTVELSAMARAALNYLRGNPEPARDFECRFSLGALGIPAHYLEYQGANAYGYDPIAIGDTDCRMEWQYRHMRAMAGEAEACAVERGVRARVLGYLRDDGYAWINPAAYVGKAVDGLYIGTWTTAKLLITLSEMAVQDDDGHAREQARHVFTALREVAQWDGDRAWYMGIAPYRDGNWLLDGWCASHGRNYPFIVEALAHYGVACEDDDAIALARACADGFLAGSQPDMRHRIDPATGAYDAHVHLHTHATWGVAHLGVLLNEPRYLAWAKAAYDFTLAHGTDFGWYPEFIPQQEYRSEICCVGDMVSNGVWLAQGVSPAYWDHVERTVRNELHRSQFFLTDDFLALFREVHQDKSPLVVAEALRFLRRLEGGFVAQSTFDDWVSYPGNPCLGSPGQNNNGIHMMGCCPPEGMRGLWEAWSWTVQQCADEVRVNMALSREHPAARVTAFRPEDGGYDVAALAGGDYLLRPPAWADRAGVTLAINGQPAPLTWAGPDDAYVACRNTAPGDLLRLRWPVPAFTQTFVPTSIPDRHDPVTVQWTGNQVTGITPRAQYLTKYGRYKGN